jgi:hypothetical protein
MTLTGPTGPAASFNFAGPFLPNNNPAATPTGTGNLTGNYGWVVTFITATGETDYNVIDGTASPSAQQVLLTNIPISSNAAVIGRNIYRTIANAVPPLDNIYYLVTTINDNVTTSYTDNTPDSSITGGRVASGSNSATGVFTGNGYQYIQPVGVSVAIGESALATHEGYANTAVGANVLAANTSGARNVGIGIFALTANTTGYQNTAIGVHALGSSTTIQNATAIGYLALGNANTATTTPSVAIGAYALNNENNANAANVAIGFNCMEGTTTGNNNVAVGEVALFANTSGSQCVAVGGASLTAQTTGLYNTGLGFQALNSLTTSNANTAVGWGSLSSNVTGANNIGVGNAAGKYETGSDALYIDALDRGSLANGKSHSLIYGTMNASVASQTLALNATVTVANGIGAYGATPPAQLTGWGTPTGNVVQNNYAGASATLAQTSAAVAQIIATLKALGIYAA